MRAMIALLVWGVLFVSALAFAANEVVEPGLLRQKFNLNSYGANPRLKDLKIAILDNGFQGFVPARGMLPSNAELVQLTKLGPAPTSHGLGMAQIIWALTGQRPDGPHFYLVNSNGFTNLKEAVKFVIRERIDLVLYSQVWPFGGNFDGTGFINQLVTQAVQAGVIWINAAGNHHDMVYNGAVDSIRDLRFENKLDENEVTITLSWNDFKDTENYNTAKDLDLFIYDSRGTLVGSSELIQKGEAPPPGGESKLSSHAREAVRLLGLERGQYQIKIKANSKFSRQDRLRVLIKSEKPGAVDFIDHTSDGELMPPADHPLAITVGEQSEESAVGWTADGRRKPEVLLDDSQIAFTNGDQVRGSSTAAAIFTGILSLMKVEQPLLNLRNLSQILARASSGSIVGVDDLRSAELMPVDPSVARLLPPEGELMIHRTRGNWVILTPDDPFNLPEPRRVGVRRSLPEDRLVYSPRNLHWSAVSKAEESSIRPPLVEFRRKTNSASLWKTPTPQELRDWVR